jgi:hypothetical protein
MGPESLNLLYIRGEKNRFSHHLPEWQEFDQRKEIDTEGYLKPPIVVMLLCS